MNKILILIFILLGSILIIVNFAAGNWFTHIIVWTSNPGMLAIVWIGIWFIWWFWLEWFLSEKRKESYWDDDELNF